MNECPCKNCLCIPICRERKPSKMTTSCELLQDYFFLCDAERPFMPKPDFTERLGVMEKIVYGKKII